MKILLAITFVFGVMRFLSITKLFEFRMSNFFEGHLIKIPLYIHLDLLFYRFSLVFQAWYWLFK